MTLVTNLKQHSHIITTALLLGAHSNRYPSVSDWTGMGSYPLHFSLCHRGYQSAKEGISELIFDKHLSVDLLMILAAIGSGLIGYWMEGLYSSSSSPFLLLWKN